MLWGDESVILSDSPNTIAPMTAPWNAPQQQPTAAKANPPRWALWVVLATAAIVTAAVGGGIVGSALTATRTETTNTDTAATTTMTTAAADAVDTHAQDVALCTKYAVINSAMPRTDENAGDLLPAVAAMEIALAENPDASTPIRAAITDVVSAYYARMAAYAPVRTRGLAEPIPHDLETQRAAAHQAWTVCGLDK